jgi:hypothetical protein
VDGDMSTNDTVLLLASGASGITFDGSGLRAFTEALTGVCGSLARQIARDGEGATRLVEVTVTGGRDEPLFRVEAFTWYVFDIAYDVDRGAYDLSISAEGEKQPVVALRDQTNVLGIPGSELRKYSFIGDIPGKDGSSAWFYVDDIVILNDVPVSELPSSLRVAACSCRYPEPLPAAAPRATGFVPILRYD